MSAKVVKIKNGWLALSVSDPKLGGFGDTKTEAEAALDRGLEWFRIALARYKVGAAVAQPDETPPII